MRIPARGGAVDRPALDRHVDAISALADGATQAGGDLTLAANATTTEVQDRRCTATSMVMLSPTSANAAATRPWIVSAANGAFTVGHDASVATDRTFHYELRRR